MWGLFYFQHDGLSLFSPLLFFFLLQIKYLIFFFQPHRVVWGVDDTMSVGLNHVLSLKRNDMERNKHCMLGN